MSRLRRACLTVLAFPLFAVGFLAGAFVATVLWAGAALVAGWRDGRGL